MDPQMRMEFERHQVSKVIRYLSSFEWRKVRSLPKGLGREFPDWFDLCGNLRSKESKVQGLQFTKDVLISLVRKKR